MNEATPSIRALRSVNVFGSSMLRVTPDIAAIVVAVSCCEPRPEVAFSAARKAAQAVNAYLHKAGVKDFGSSRITLTQERRFSQDEVIFAGYRAQITFNIIAREMDQVDALLAGVIASGATELHSVSFQTSQMKEVRADARRRAVTAAREKAELYCNAAGVRAGRVLLIEDVNPNSVPAYNEVHHPRGASTPPVDATEPGSIDPGAIVVTAAVNVMFEIESVC